MGSGRRLNERFSCDGDFFGVVVEYSLCIERFYVFHMGNLEAKKQNRKKKKNLVGDIVLCILNLEIQRGSRYWITFYLFDEHFYPLQVSLSIILLPV